MSRAAVSKSRAEKGGKPPASQTPVVAHEIVPGKFNDHDWNVMLDKDGDEEFVEDIVGLLIDTSMDKIHDHYIQRQLLPFTITQAKDAILQIVEWQFLSRDDGEANPDTDVGWLEDEEPDPAVTDCWAQGSVPRTLVAAPTPEPIMEEVEEEEEEEQQQTAVAEEELPVEEEVPELEDKVSDAEDDSPEDKPQVAETEDAKSEQEKASQQKKRRKFKPHRGPLRSAGLSRMTESLEQTEMQIFVAELEATYQNSEDHPSGLLNMPASCQSLLKVQAGRPPGNKDVVYDDMGNVVAIVKLNPERLPSHRVTVKYQVVDPSVEAEQAKLEAMRTGRYVGVGQKGPRGRAAQKQKTETKTEKNENLTETKTPLPPPLVETMEVATGVIVKEGGRVKRGPGRYIRRSEVLPEGASGLRPVAPRATGPQMVVADLLDRHTPILRPLGDSPPLPPIIPHPPSQTRHMMAT